MRALKRIPQRRTLALIGILLVVAGILAISSINGCRDDSAAELRRIRTMDPRQTRAKSQDHFSMAMGFLDNFEQFDEQTAIARILSELNRWSETQKPDEDWIADPLFNRLPPQLKLRRDAAALSRLKFHLSDVLTLRAATWARDLSQYITNHGQIDFLHEKWLANQNELLGTAAARNLRSCLQTFDWVVRNIQLDPFAEMNTEGLAEERLIEVPPGVTRLAWEALLTGHGDAWTRARAFILITRQLDIPVIMLAIDRQPTPEPWLNAALIAGQLYLFDPMLGIPIPDATGEGVATLEQLRADPALIGRLRLDGEHLQGSDPYRFNAKDLDNLVALIDGTEQYLSQRMKLIESALSGEEKMILTTTPSALRRQLTSSGVVKDATLWTLPYFQWQFQQLMSRDPKFVNQQFLDRRLFLDGSVLARARRQHFRGELSGDDQNKGAKALYLQCRIPNQRINQIETSAATRKSLGMEDHLPEDAVQRRNLIKLARDSMIDAKQYASYWLGIIAQESQRYDVANDFFQRFTLDAFPNGRWTQGATYNLARIHETLGRTNQDVESLRKAQQLYLADKDSPQAYGNRLRARRLDELID